MLSHLEIDIFQAQLAETIAEKRFIAHNKHGDKSIEEVVNFDRLMTILTEEVGEVAEAINDAYVLNLNDSQLFTSVESELIDVITVSSAWLHRIQLLRAENVYRNSEVR